MSAAAESPIAAGAEVPGPATSVAPGSRDRVLMVASAPREPGRVPGSAVPPGDRPTSASLHELTAAAGSGGAARTVRLAPRSEPPASPLRVTTPAHVLAPVLGSAAALSRPRPTAPTRSRADEPGVPAGPMPDPTPLCCAMVQAAVEGLRGVRPLAQLTRWVTPEVYEGLLVRAELVQRAGRPRAARAGIRRIRMFRIGEEVAEAGVVVDDGPRVRAVAVRLEAHRGRWRAVAMEIG